MDNLPAVLEVEQTTGTLVNDMAACKMARTFQEATAEMRRMMHAIDDQCRLLNAVFNDEKETYNRFDLDFSTSGTRCYRSDRENDYAAIFDQMNRAAWRTLIEKLGLRNIMSVAKRKEFDQQLERGELPAIEESTILDILYGLVGQARTFATEAAKEVFEILRPRNSDYKTNDAFRVGRRVILAHRVERKWDGKTFRVNYHREQEITAIDGIFHLLDGKGIMRENRGPLFQSINTAPDGKGETDYFRFKCFKNGNLHLEFKRLDLVQELNLLAVGERVLGNDVE